MGCVSIQDFQRPDNKIVKHPLTELGKGKYVNIKPLTARDLIELQSQQSDGIEFALRVLRFCLVDDDGHCLFHDDQQADCLKDFPPKLIERLGEKAVEVSGLGEHDG